MCRVRSHLLRAASGEARCAQPKHAAATVAAVYLTTTSSSSCCCCFCLSRSRSLLSSPRTLTITIPTQLWSLPSKKLNPVRIGESRRYRKTQPSRTWAFGSSYGGNLQMIEMKKSHTILTRISKWKVKNMNQVLEELLIAARIVTTLNKFPNRNGFNWKPAKCFHYRLYNLHQNLILKITALQCFSLGFLSFNLV